MSFSEHLNGTFGTAAFSLPATWVPEIQFRGTFSILSTCLSTLAFCVWGAVHMDISEGKSVRSLPNKLGWLGGALLVPELVLFIAYMQRLWAYWLVKKSNDYFHFKAPPSKLKKARHWIKELLHASGEDGDIEDKEKQEKPALDQIQARSSFKRRKYQWTLTHGFYAVMGGFVIDTKIEHTSEPGTTIHGASEPDTAPLFPTVHQDRLMPTSLREGRLTLTPEGVAFLMQHDPDLIPDISEEYIKDHSKADGIAKLLQLFQVAWFCSNCVARLVLKLPMSFLEVSTLAHAVCMIITFMLWWYKPLNIRDPSIIDGIRARQACGLLLHMSGVRSTGKFNLGGLHMSRDYFPKPDPEIVKTLAEQAVANYGIPIMPPKRPRTAFVVPCADLQYWPSSGSLKLSNVVRTSIATALLTAVYGSVHFIPWYDEFPTNQERWLWRIAVAIVTAAGACHGTIAVIHTIVGKLLKPQSGEDVEGYSEKSRWSSKKIKKRVDMFLAVVTLICISWYCCASLLLVAESFRQLGRLPAGAHQTPSFTNYWPHFT